MAGDTSEAPILAKCEQLRCIDCLEWLSLGPSNDEPEAVKIEMRAAELAADYRVLRDGDMFGWRSFGLGLFPYPDELAGYLARCISTPDEER